MTERRFTTKDIQAMRENSRQMAENIARLSGSQQRFLVSNVTRGQNGQGRCWVNYRRTTLGGQITQTSQQITAKGIIATTVVIKQ